MKVGARVLDSSAIGLSGLCLIHCLVMPIAAALLPVLGAWAEAEWVHILFVAVAAPLSGFALLRQTHGAKTPSPLIALAFAGILFLAFGAFLAPTERIEVTASVCGSLCLAGAHLWNWRRRVAGAGAHHHC